MRVIAFTGLPGSGKSVAVDVLRRRGVPVIRMGDFVLQEVERRGLPLEEAHIGPVATQVRADEGPDVWAVRTIEALRSGAVPDVTTETRLVVVDGVRSMDEVRRFQSDLGGDFTLVAVTAEEDVRHARILGRGRADDSATRQLVSVRDARERGWGVESAIQAADHTIPNEADQAAFEAAVTALADRLLTS